MEEKEFPMDYFTPIITINETPPEEKSTIAPNESSKITKVEIKTEPTPPEEPPVKRKRGRPRKNEIVINPVKKRKYKRRSKDKAKKTEKTTKKGKKKAAVTEKKDKVEVKIEYDEDGNEIKPVVKIEIKEEPKSETDGDQPVEPKLFKCPTCKDSEERTEKQLKEHYKQSHPDKRLRASKFSTEVHPCDICSKEFKTSSSLKDHMETHNNYYYCELCNHSTKKLLDHIIHLRVHSEVGLFQCLMCDFKNAEINRITEHINNHVEVLKYWCDSCKKGFQILSHFQEHDNYHTGLKPFDCEYCGKCFLYSRYLHAHKTNLHKEDMNYPKCYQCVLCCKQYQHKNSLKLHMNAHTGNFSICDICGKTLSSKEKLKFHLRTHTGYKPFSCQYCGKCFTKKPILVEHVRIHTGERPYICDYCTKAFSQRSSLVIHMRGHTGEKPYVCQFCTKGFVAKAMLNIHLKSCRGLFHIAKTEY